MGKFFTFRLACTVFIATLTSATYYNEAKLTLYTRLSQQLRYQMAEHMQETITRVTAITTQLNTARADLTSSKHAMSDLFHAYDLELEDTLQQTNIYPVTAMQVRVSDSYPWTTANIFWNTLEWTHGFEYNTNSGDTRIEKTGLYLMEYCLMETPITYMRVRIIVRRPDGSERYNIQHHLMWGTSPVLQTFLMYRGDTFDTVTMAASGNLMWTYGGVPITVIGGIANQLVLRYIGEG